MTELRKIKSPNMTIIKSLFKGLNSAKNRNSLRQMRINDTEKFDNIDENCSNSQQKRMTLNLNHINHSDRILDEIWAKYSIPRAKSKEYLERSQKNLANSYFKVKNTMFSLNSRFQKLKNLLVLLQNPPTINQSCIRL
jgi:hypothetical protein